MASKKQLWPRDVEAWARKFWDANHRRWLVDDEGAWPATRVLSSLTEQDLMQDITGARAWVSEWSAWQEHRRPGTVEWVERRWSSGRQSLPISISFSSEEEIARLVGESSRWRRARARYARFTERWPALAGAMAVGRHFEVLADYGDGDFERLMGMLSWLAANPLSGLYLRQLPIAGFDTKWAEKRKALLTDLMQSIRGQPDECDFERLCGLRAVPKRIRLRVLCPRLRAQVGGLEDIEAPVEEIDALALAPSAVLVVENLQTGLALPQLEGVVAFMRLGHSIDLLAGIGWLRSVPRNLYWGDLDTHGLVILGRARLMFPQTESLLMDEATLLVHRELWVEEREQAAVDAPAGLTPTEQKLFASLKQHRWGASVRLEQERLDWPTVVDTLSQRFAPGSERGSPGECQRYSE